jgi:phenylacetate-CoA ligase
MPALAPHYQLVVSATATSTSSKCCANCATGRIRRRHVEALAANCSTSIKTYVGVTTQVTPAAANGIERSLTGKARRVVDQRPKN